MERIESFTASPGTCLSCGGYQGPGVDFDSWVGSWASDDGSYVEDQRLAVCYTCLAAAGKVVGLLPDDRQRAAENDAKEARREADRLRQEVDRLNQTIESTRGLVPESEVDRRVKRSQSAIRNNARAEARRELTEQAAEDQTEDVPA